MAEYRKADVSPGSWEKIRKQMRKQKLKMRFAHKLDSEINKTREKLQLLEEIKNA